MISGGLGNDESLLGSLGNDRISGGAGSDQDLAGGAGEDVIRGGAGVDVFDDGTRQFDDVYRGGPGRDYVLFGGGGGPVVADLNTGEATGQGNDRLFGIENLFSGPGADILIGNDVANDLRGFGGNDQIEGRGGDDSLNGGDDTDTLDGGDGANDVCINGETVLNCEA